MGSQASELPGQTPALILKLDLHSCSDVPSRCWEGPWQPALFSLSHFPFLLPLLSVPMLILFMNFVLVLLEKGREIGSKSVPLCYLINTKIY